MFIRYDKGTEFVAVRADANLFYYVFMTFEFLLYLRRIDILAIREDDDFLRASCDEDASVLAYGSKVTRVDKPISIDDLGRLFGTVVVALHHIRAFGTKLPVNQFHLDTWHRLAHATWHQFAWTGKGYHRSCFRHAVAVEQVYAQRLHSCCDLKRQGGSAVHTEFQMSAQFLLHSLEDETRKTQTPHPLA